MASLDIVYRHQEFYVVYKPANMSVQDQHLDDGIRLGFFNFCCELLNEKLYLVHRLDFITSGLLILARTKEAAQYFQQAFADKQIEKLYLALSDKKPKKKQGHIIGDMDKARNGQWKLLPSKKSPAYSQFVSFLHPMADETNYRLFVVKPLTGKTHQIRVALKSVSSAILGDELYKGTSADRGYLHAFALRFNYGEQSHSFTVMPKEGNWLLTNNANLNAQLVEILQQPFDLTWPKNLLEKK